MERNTLPTCQSLQQSSRGRCDMMYPIPPLDLGRISKFPSPSLGDCYYGQLCSSTTRSSHLQMTSPTSWINNRTMNRRSHGISDILCRSMPPVSYRSLTPPPPPPPPPAKSAVYGNMSDIPHRSSGNLRIFPSFYKYKFM